MPSVDPNWPIPPTNEARLLTDFLHSMERLAVCARIHLHVNIFFANRLEVAGPREPGEPRFQGTIISGCSFSQGNAAAQVAVAELVQPLEFDSPTTYG